MSTYFLLVLWKKNGYKVSQFGSTLSFLELRTSSSSSTFRELFLSVYYITFSIYGKPWPAMWYSSSSWRQSWACLPSTCVVTCFAGIGMMWMNVQCHIIISSTTSLSLKKGHSTRPSLVTKITSLPAVSIFFVQDQFRCCCCCFVFIWFLPFFTKNTHSINVKKLKNYTQKFIKIVSENLQTRST